MTGKLISAWLILCGIFTAPTAYARMTAPDVTQTPDLFDKAKDLGPLGALVIMGVWFLRAIRPKVEAWFDERTEEIKDHRKLVAKLSIMLDERDNEERRELRDAIDELRGRQNKSAEGC